VEALILAAVLLALFRKPGDSGAPPPVTQPPRPQLPAETFREVDRWRVQVEEETRNRANVWTSLLLALILKESRGDPAATGSTSDYGLCQITRPAWQDYQTETGDLETVVFPDSMFDPRLNIRVGAWFLNRKIEEMGNARDGLRAYNAGTAGARRNPNQSADYADSILRYEPIFKVTA
jgi:soluble lytic murein transglycosylase-like protein